MQERDIGGGYLTCIDIQYISFFCFILFVHLFAIPQRQVQDLDMRLLEFSFFSCDLAKVHHRRLGNHLAPCHCSNMGKWDWGWEVQEEQREGRRRVTSKDLKSSEQRTVGRDRFSYHLNIFYANKICELWRKWVTLVMQTPWRPPPLTCADVLEKSVDAQQVHGLFMHVAIFGLCLRLK